MQYLKGRDNFNYNRKLDYLLENLNISNELKLDLEKIKNPVARLLLTLSRSKVERNPYRQDHIGYGDRRSYLSFDKGKNSIKVGRFINQLIKKLKDDYAPDFDNDPNKVPIQMDGKDITEQDVQKFVDEYNQLLADKMKPVDMTILKSDDIVKAYQLCGNVSGSPLSRSCMVGEEKWTFDIYRLNPDKVSLATLWADDKPWTELLGRALLWNTDDGIKIMDRIYFDNADAEQKFKTWAGQNGYAYRKYQDYEAEHAKYFVENGSDEYYDYLSVSLKDVRYSAFPYMDTFKFLDDKKCLTNTRQENSIASLEHTDGSYTNLNPGRNIERLFKPENMVDVFENIYKNSPTPFGQPDEKVDKKIDILEQDDLVLVVNEWNYFQSLFENHENQTFITDVLEGDGWKYFDYGLGDFASDVDSYWEDIKDDTLEKIVWVCKYIKSDGDYSKEEFDETKESDFKVFKATNREEFKKVIKDNPDLKFDAFQINTTANYKRLSYSDNYYKKNRYFATSGDYVGTLASLIDKDDDFEELKDHIRYGYLEAKQAADEEEAWEIIINSILDYFDLENDGFRKYKVTDKIMIKIDPDTVKDLLIDNLSDADLEDFTNEYESLLNGNSEEDLIDILNSCIRWYNLPNPNFQEPYYGFDGDPSKMIDERVYDKIHDGFGMVFEGIYKV